MQAKQYIPCATAALFSTTALFGASPQSNIEYLHSQISKIETETVENTWGGRNPTTRPDNYESRGVRLYTSGDFLYWHADQEGLDYAVTSSNPIFVDGSSLDGGHLKKPNFNWKPGFRLGLGYNIPFDQWDLYFTWTRLETEANGHAAAPTGGGLASVWLPLDTGTTGPITSARSHWHLSYDVIDLELGRSFFFTKALCGRPFLGLRGVWMNQRFDNQYSFSALSPAATADLRQSFHAPALRGGLNLNWRFTNSFSFVANASASLAYGKFNIKQDDDLPSSATPLPSVNVRDKFHSVKANVEAALGLQWETYFSKNRYHFALAAAYEYVDWFNQNQLTNYQYDVSGGNTFVKHLKGDLSLQGLTLSARFDF
jgi:hypothetical protein